MPHPLRRLAAGLGALGLVVLTAPGSSADGFTADEQAAIVEIVEKGMAQERQPGLLVGIWIPGRGEFVRPFGVGNTATKTPMRRADHVRIASITKTFVATAVLHLADQGKLGLDDRLAAWVDEIPNGQAITVRNLLGMTSGIYDFTSDQAFLKAFTDNPTMPFGALDVIDIVKRHPPAFAPGEKVVYCDTNYVLLGLIIEQVTGRPVAEVIRTEILASLGLESTSFPTTPTMPVPFARGYYAGEDGKGELKDYTASNPMVAWTAGAMISTLDDLRGWAKALATGALLAPATYREQMRMATMARGAVELKYGLGVADLGGLIGHNGAIFGYTTAMFYVPSADATIVIAGNQASNFSNAATEIAYAVAKRLMPNLIQ